MNPWAEYPVPAQRAEALYGDRLVRCFAQRPRTLRAMFAAACARAPQACVLVCEGRQVSYAQCDAIAQRLAGGLAARGVQAGARVVMFIDNRPEFVFVLLALAHLGAIAVPVGVREQRPGLAYIARQCGAIGIVADAELAERLPDANEAPAAGAARGDRWRAGLHATTTRCWRTKRPVPAAADPAETDVAAILYTSGTTGNPKGAMLTHLGIVHSVMHFEACMKLGAGEVSALAVPASHVTGLIAVIATMIRVAGCTVIVPAFKAEPFIALMQRERVTHTLMVPAMYNLCLLQPGFAQADLSAWRVGGYGGAPMPVATIDALAHKLPGLTLLNAYGATETTSPTTMMPMGETRAHADSVGVPLPTAEVRVMDDSGREVPPGDSGELWIAGPMVVPGYWANAEATAASFTAGWWHSGDLGSVDAAGLRAGVRPQEGHAQPRRLQDLFGRGRERADGLARHGRGRGDRPAVPGARRAGARLRARARRRGRRRRAARLLRRAAGRLQGAGNLQLERRAAAAQRQRQADEAPAARSPRPPRLDAAPRSTFDRAQATAPAGVVHCTACRQPVHVSTQRRRRRRAGMRCPASRRWRRSPAMAAPGSTAALPRSACASTALTRCPSRRGDRCSGCSPASSRAR